MSHQTVIAAAFRLQTPLLLILMVLTAFGCGVKGPLVEKGEQRPIAPGALALQQQGSDALLSWTIPSVNQDGSVLDNLEQFVIFRLPYRPGNFCEECRDPETGLIRIHLDQPDPAIRYGDQLFLRDPDLRLNMGYRYRIVTLNARGEQGADATVHRVMLEPPNPPVQIQVVELDRSVQIVWESENSSTEEGKQTGINIYRAIGDEPYGPVPLNSQPLTETRYEDFGLENNQTYRYGLRTVITVDTLVIESALSEPVTATPKPVF